MRLLERIRDDGPLAASKLETGRTGWWEWSESKRMREWLFWAGHITTAARGPSFERVYDLTERVIPAETLALPTPTEAEAHRCLVERACPGHRSRDGRRAVRLLPTRPPGREAGDIRSGGRGGARPSDRSRLAGRVPPPRGPPPSTDCGQGAARPFDPLVWERARTERLFGFRYRSRVGQQVDGHAGFKSSRPDFFPKEALRLVGRRACLLRFPAFFVNQRPVQIRGDLGRVFIAFHHKPL